MEYALKFPCALGTKGINKYLNVPTAAYSLLATSDSQWETNILLCISKDTPTIGASYTKVY